MSATDLILRLLAIFERLHVQYMMVGSYSSNYYGRPRSTRDADFVLILSAEQFDGLRATLDSDSHLVPQLSFETITMTTRHVILHPATAFKIELFLLTDDPHDRSRFARRRQVEFEGHPTWLPTAEDVIIQKLRWSRGGKRTKDLADAMEVVRLQKPNLDLPYIRQWTTQHQTLDLFERLLANAGARP